jgi:mycofactocin precursor peptide peptidase
VFPSLTSSDLVGLQPIVLIPVGSYEQHGPHLPLDTDTQIAIAVVAACVPDNSTNIVVAPALSMTASDEHAGFPGTLSVGTHAFALSAIAIAQSATQWARGVLFVNGHGGNSDAFTRVTTSLSEQQIPHAVWNPPVEKDDDMHAGNTETSLLLHISPEDVRMDKLAPGNQAPLSELLPHMRTGGIRAVSHNGVLGDPTQASAANGKKIFDRYCESLRSTIGDVLSKWS